MEKELPRVVDFSKVGKEDVELVGGKGANLGEMTQVGLPVPPGFIVTAPAYFDFLEYNGFRKRIGEIVSEIDVREPEQLQVASSQIKRLIISGKVPQGLVKQIFSAYHSLGKWRPALVAVRSSATAEDLPEASFAGQQETFLNVQGEAHLIEAVRAAWASLFTARAIFYREEKKFDHFKVGIAVPVQKMVQSEVSGVMFTIDPITNDKNRIVIEAIWGLGELIVQGAITPDHYVVDKENWEIKIKEVAKQEEELVKKGQETKRQDVPKSRKEKAKLTDKEMVNLAKIGQKVQEHYFFPQDIEWAYEKGKLYLVQTRPVTTIKEEKKGEKGLEVRVAGRKVEPVLVGSPASPGIATGPVKVVKSPKELGKVKQGDILVAEMTSPDFVPAMKRAVGIITDKGGLTSHAAIVSREMGTACVVGTGEATKKLKDGTVVTLNGKSGEIWLGSHTPTVEEGPKTEMLNPEVDTSKLKTATKIYVNLAEADLAKKTAKKNVNGVGLLRAEFMIANIGVHPRQLLKEGKEEVFIKALSSDMGKIAKAFFPRPVVYRTTDLKTNEYRNLKGGEKFEPQEPNPMLGFRGAFRYTADEGVFKMELEAIKRVRERGLYNLWVMIPFVRSPGELAQVKKIMVEANLVRSGNFKLWLMVELPVNVISLGEFIKVGIDGVSIGSNDLTMLILGTDRDNAEVAQAFNEQDKAVLWALKRTIRICNKHGVTSSICGQAPSTYPTLVRKLVDWGISSVSVNPDAIDLTRQVVYDEEKRKVNKRK